VVEKVRVRYFKKFSEQTFDLADHVVLAGPNNSGKSTLLQAIVVWNLALQKWKSAAREGAKQRTGVPITRKDFTAIPLREMNLLWTDTSTALRTTEAGKTETGKSRAGSPRAMEIELSGRKPTDAEPWSLTFEFRYQSSEQIYVKPGEGGPGDLPPQAVDLNVAHVPPFSGIGAQETRYDRPFQDLLIGQGKPGDILRNLLMEVQRDNKADWRELTREIEEVFGYRLLDPKYEGMPYIVCEYRPNKGRAGVSFDISSAGSGFHQVLMLLAFFYARPSSLLLLDEPDAHLHVILQKQIYDMLRSIAAKRRCQLVVATHSEVLIDGTSPERILSFYGAPHQLLQDRQRDQVREAMKRLTAMDILLAESSEGILYLEGETDFNLLRAWAKVLKHPLYEKWFTVSPFWHSNQGRNPREAKAHFFALRAIKPNIRGYLLLDGDNRNLPDHEVSADGLGLEIGRWVRYEAESYLVHPEVLKRFLEPRVGGELFAAKCRQFLDDELPAAVLRDPLKDHDYLNRTPASKTLLPGALQAAGDPLSKDEYYLIAEQMERGEIAPEITEKLDRIAAALGVVCDDRKG
jgi:predicted ATPase